MVPYSPHNDYVIEGRDKGKAKGPSQCDFPPGIAEVPV